MNAPSRPRSKEAYCRRTSTQPQRLKSECEVSTIGVNESSRCTTCRTRSQVLMRCGQARRRSIVNSRIEGKHTVQYPGVRCEKFGSLELHLLQFAGILSSQICAYVRNHAIAWDRIFCMWLLEFDACNRWMVLKCVDNLWSLQASPTWHSVMGVPSRGSKASGRTGVVAGRKLIIISTLEMELWRDWALFTRARLRTLPWTPVERDYPCARPRLFWIAEDYSAGHTHTITPTDTR